MAEEKNIKDIKDFTINFFQNLKCTISINEEVYTITNAPKDFEDFFGKKSPYYLVFEKSREKENTELITQGSYLLKAIKDYLDNKGQTTLLKLEINVNPIEIIKKKLSLKGCSINNISKKVENKTIIRFTFSSVFQYLNEKEQIINEIYTDDSGIINFNINKYSIIEGDKEEVSIKDIKEYHAKAKEQLKKNLVQNTEEISHLLEKKLDREKERIGKHFSNQIKEIDEEINKNSERIRILEEQKKKAAEKDIPIIEEKISGIKEAIKAIQKDNLKEKIKKEEEFLLNDEIRKHSLNINNKLVNTSIIYYPVFLFNFILFNDSTRRYYQLKYNPITDEISRTNCENCKKEIDEIYLCFSGHISCEACLDKCECCNKQFCKNCLDKKCDICGKLLCKNCSVKCKKCWKQVCKTHMVKNSTGEEYCINCLKFCAGCKSWNLKEKMKKCRNCGVDLCEKCAKGNLCFSCSKKCSMCGNLVKKTELVKCAGCKAEYCAHIEKCLSCKKQLCYKLKR
ncbi:hypothetical protein HYW76_02135 [Candidatus Pacearchaeota archaeon]|nr:hypothetical protein [Candidatus Pacearchaeota archaeon]